LLLICELLAQYPRGLQAQIVVKIACLLASYTVSPLSASNGLEVPPAATLSTCHKGLKTLSDAKGREIAAHFAHERQIPEIRSPNRAPPKWRVWELVFFTASLGVLIPMLTLEHLLQPFGLDTSRRTKLVRHQEQGIDVAALHRAGQLEFYQTFQGRPVFANCDQIVSFLGSAGSQAVFVGVYEVLEVSGPRAIELRDDFLYPEMNVSSVYVYNLVRDKRFDALSERLVIDWGAGTRSWVQNFKQGGKEVVEVLPKGYVKEFPGFLDD
jgi:hypothetical protein